MTGAAPAELLKYLRIGIAFEGGGAKGSFGWAVMERLHEAGIHPIAVSGTSAGSLSAVAVASGKFAEASDLYRRLVLKDIFPFKLHPLLAVPLFALIYISHATVRLATGMNATHVQQDSALANTLPRIVLTVAMMALAFFGTAIYMDPAVSEAKQLHWQWFDGLFPMLTVWCWAIATFEAPNQYIRLFVLSLAGGLLFVFFEAFPWKHFYSLQDPTFAQFKAHAFGFFSILAALVWIISKKRNTTFNYARATLATVFFLAVYKIVFVLPWKIIRSSEHPSFELVQPYLIAFAPLLVLAAIYACALLFTTMTLASNCALRTKVEHLARDGLAIDCFVALSSIRKVFDPTNPTVRTVNTGIHYPVHVPVYIPFYFNLKNSNPEEIGLLAVASAALPFGVVPASTYQGCDYVDGAMADNCPIRPLVDDVECDLLITIHLRRNAPLGDAKSHYQAAWRLTKLLEHRSRWNEENGYEPDTDGWWESVWPVTGAKMPIHVPIMPDIDLGCLLDFRKTSIESRIAEGHKKGQEFVELLMQAFADA